MSLAPRLRKGPHRWRSTSPRFPLTLPGLCRLRRRKRRLSSSLNLSLPRHLAMQLHYAMFWWRMKFPWVVRVMIVMVLYGITFPSVTSRSLIFLPVKSYLRHWKQPLKHQLQVASRWFSHWRCSWLLVFYVLCSWLGTVPCQMGYCNVQSDLNRFLHDKMIENRLVMLL